MEESNAVTLFLNVLYGRATTGLLEIRYLADGEKPIRRWYKLREVPLGKLQAANEAGRNVYFGVGLREGQRGKKEDVIEIPAVWVDLDEKDFREGKAEALRALERMPPELPPSIILDSGHGIHAYWLVEPVVMPNGNGEADLVERTLRGLAHHLGGDPSVADIARIMRLPGFFNVKDRANPVPCQILEIHDDRRYDLADLALFGQQASPPALAGERSAHDVDRPRLPAVTLDFLARGAVEGERNDAAFAAACQLRDAGYPEAEALALVLEGAARCTPPLPEREVQATVKSAFSRTPRNPLAEVPVGSAAAASADVSAEREAQPELQPLQAPGAGFGSFITSDGAPILVQWRTTRDGASRYQVPIARFVPRVVGETERHKSNGEVIRTCELEVRTWRSRVTLAVSPEVLADPRRFFATCVGAVGADARLIDASATRFLPLAAMELAPEDRPRETVYEMTGWQEIGGKLCYLSPSGGIGMPEGVKVDLSNLEQGIGLTQDGLRIGGVADEGDAVFEAGVKALLSAVLHAFSPATMLIALAFTFLAPLMRWSPVPDRPALHFIGSTGSGKSTLLSLLQAFFGCFRFLLSWQSTGNHLEIAMSQTRDMIVTVDDLKMSTSDRGVGVRLIQSYADRRGRGRATRSGELAQARFAGGLLVSAGEDIPEGEASVAARSLFVTVKRGAMDVTHVSEAQRAAPALATVMGRYVAWLLAQGEEQVRAAFKVRFFAHRSDYREILSGVGGVNDAGRVATSCALIHTAAGFLWDFLASVGAVTAEEKEEKMVHTQLELIDLAQSQARIMIQETYVQAFLSALRTLIETRDVYLVPVAEGENPPPLHTVSPPASYPPGAKGIGWQRWDGEIWLRPDAVMSLANVWLARQGRPAPSREGLYRQLDDAGVLARKSGDKSTYVTRIGGEATRVLALVPGALAET
ncbi:MAG: DUF927 domain-containing protein [Anaerolineae bacterium]|nr:DUF927 domain-containing protein [Anaerolineae bacterium]